jgi:hypothetical protein
MLFRLRNVTGPPQEGHFAFLGAALDALIGFPFFKAAVFNIKLRDGGPDLLLQADHRLLANFEQPSLRVIEIK